MEVQLLLVWSTGTLACASLALKRMSHENQVPTKSKTEGRNRTQPQTGSRVTGSRTAGHGAASRHQQRARQLRKEPESLRHPCLAHSRTRCPAAVELASGPHLRIPHRDSQ